MFTDPFAGKRLYVDPDSPAQRQAETWKRSQPADAALIARIANEPVARWFGDWSTNIRREVNQAVATITGGETCSVVPYSEAELPPKLLTVLRMYRPPSCHQHWPPVLVVV